MGIYKLEATEREWILQHYVVEYKALPGSKANGEQKKGDKKKWVKETVLVEFLDQFYPDNSTIDVTKVLDAICSALRNVAYKDTSTYERKKAPRRTNAKSLYWHANLAQVEIRGRELKAKWEAENMTDDENDREAGKERSKAAGLTWQRAALNELYAGLDDDERVIYERLAHDHNKSVNDGPAVEEIYEMQKHLPTAVAKSLKQFIGFGTNQMGVVAFSIQMAYVDKDGNTRYDHQLVHPHQDWKNITTKGEFINAEQKTRFLEYANAGFKLAQNPKPKLSQATPNKVEPRDEPDKENIKPAKRIARRLRLDDDEDENVETLEDELRALEKEAEHDDDTSTQYYQAKVMQDLQEKRRKAREDEVAKAKAKARAIAAAADAEDRKRRQEAELAAQVELQIDNDHSQFEDHDEPISVDEDDDGDHLAVERDDDDKVVPVEEEEEEEVAPVADGKQSAEEEEHEDDEHEDEEIVKKVLAARGKKGRRVTGTAQTTGGSKGTRNTKVMSTNSLPLPTTRAPKRKANNDGGSAPRKSARLSAVDDAPRATRASVKAKEGVKAGRKGPARGKGRR